MYCADCDACLDATNGDGFLRHVCHYTGVTVFPRKHDLVDGHLAVSDRKEAICPRRLETLLYSAVGRSWARGILVTVWKRHLLGELLKRYSPAEAKLLEGLATGTGEKAEGLVLARAAG